MQPSLTQIIGHFGISYNYLCNFCERLNAGTMSCSSWCPHSFTKQTLLDASSVPGFLLGIECKGIISPYVLNVKIGTSAPSETLERTSVFPPTFDWLLLMQEGIYLTGEMSA